jgi:hypothetical protein
MIPRGVLAAAALAAAIGSAAAAASAAETRVVESSAERVVLDVLVPPPDLAPVEAEGERFTRASIAGAAPWLEAGKPGVVRLPILVGIPAGARPEVRVIEEDLRAISDCLLYPTPRDTIVSHGGLPSAVERFAWDRAAYAQGGAFPAERARVVSVSRSRFQEVAAIEVYPIRCRAAERAIDVATRMRIEVRFGAARGRGVEGAPGKEGRAALEAAPDDARWERLYGGLTANADAARPFRARPARGARPEAPAGKRGAGPGGSAGETEWKLTVIESGLYRIPFETLRPKGFPLGVPIEEIRLFQRSVDDTLLFAGGDPFREVEIPLDLVDTDGDSLFGPGDAVHAYVRGFRDQFPRDNDDMFTTRAVYWLAVTPGAAGARMSDAPGWLGFEGLTPPRSFLSTVHFEPDVYFNADSPSELYDLWFAVDFTRSATLGIELSGVDASRDFRFRVQSVGRANVTAEAPYRFAFAANGTPFASFSYVGRIRALYRPDSTFSGALLREGTNAIEYAGSRGGDGSAGSGAYIDWIEIDYGRFYRASGGRLAFTSGDASGPSEFLVGGFPGSDLFLYDVTNPLAPLRVRADSIVAGDGGSAIRFQADVASLRRYEAATAAGARSFPDSLLAADTSDDLAGDEADYVMIAYDDFAPGLAPLVALRESQGMRVKVARLSDVYDEWNGGMPSPDAIRRYMKYALTWWETPPAYLLLVGDASEDHARRVLRNDIDYVPSHPEYTDVIFDSADRWDASDNWYVLLDGPRLIDAATDDLVDILVGRMSVGSLGELAAQVEKTVAYERGDYGEPWRSRYLLVADDEWIQVGNSYCDVNQHQFRTRSERIAKTIVGATAISLDSVLIRVSDVTDRLHTFCDDDTTTPCLPLGGVAGGGMRGNGNVCIIDSVRADATPALFDVMNDGALFVNYQGHGNRWVLSHESILLDGYNHILSGYYRNDVASFAPSGRPNIFMAYGCSISEFERLNPIGTFDDCLTEKMMSVQSGGTVATFGSTGLEYLDPNLILNEEIVDVLLAGASGNPPRFLLGEVLALGMARYAAIGYQSSMLRYVLFGDPALRIEPAPSSFVVRVDGVETADGAYIGARDDGAPIRIVVASPDPAVLAALRVARSDQGPLDPSLYPVEGDSALLSHTVEYAAYDLIFRAPAVGGGTRTVTLRVGLETEVTFGGRTIEDGDLIDPDAEIVIDVATPLAVGASGIEVRLDGARIAAVPERTGPRSWRIVLDGLDVADGEHDLEIVARTLSKTIRFEVRDAFEVFDPLTVPNPLREGTATFSFRLTRDADRVDISIYTVNGRKVREIRGLAGRAGYNPSGGFWDGVWDARDEDGDDVANGVYLYRVRAFAGSRSAEAIGKLVVIRTPARERESAERRAN